MVLDKFNMVDMGGIDIIESQGSVVDGLFHRLVESILKCRFQVLYNWKFDGIVIPPTAVELSFNAGIVSINEYITVDEYDVVHIESFTPPPTILPLIVGENGEYTAPEGVSGYNPIEVAVPPPVLESIEITENGVYIPPSGIDGYNSIDVSVDLSNSVKISPCYPGGVSMVIDGSVVKAYNYNGGIFIPNNENNSHLDVDWSLDFEIHVRFMTRVRLSSSKCIFGCFNNYYGCPACEIRQDGTIGFGYTTNGSSWAIFQWSTFALDVNVWYDIIVIRSNGTVTFIIEQDGIEKHRQTHTVGAHYHNSGKLLSFFFYGNANNMFNSAGCIDLSNTYIMSQNTLVWGNKL